MKEVIVSQDQVYESVSALNEEASKVFDSSAKERGLYTPDTSKVNRPSFNLFKASIEKMLEGPNPPGIMKSAGVYKIPPNETGIVADYPGLRVVARTKVTTSKGMERLTVPGIVLPGGKEVALLIAETEINPMDLMNKKKEDKVLKFTETQHLLLNTEYVKGLAEVSEQHSHRDVTNVGDIGPSIVIASNRVPQRAHADLHRLAEVSVPGQSFGTNISNTGRQDFRSPTGEVRSVRSTVVSIDRTVLYVAEQLQLPQEKRLLGIELTEAEMAVGLTLSATVSRDEFGRRPDLAANMSHMVGE